MKNKNIEEYMYPSKRMIVVSNETMRSNRFGVETNIKSKRKFDASFTEDQNELLLKAHDKSMKKFTEKLIDYNLRGNLNGYIETSGIILPSIYKKKYDKAVKFETDDFDLFFVDYSIKYFKDYINELEDKTKLEALKKSIDKLNKYDARFMNLSVNLTKDKKGLLSSVEQIKGSYMKVIEESMKNINYNYYNNKFTAEMFEAFKLLIDEFIKLNGKIDLIFNDNRTLIAKMKSYGQLTVNGINNCDEVAKYIYTISKNNK